MAAISVESMFEQSLVAAVSAAPTPSARAAALIRLENATCAARLNAMYQVLHAAQTAAGALDRDQWRCDNWAAVCAQLGAAQHLTPAVVHHQLHDATALAERLPTVGALFAQGLLTYRLIHLICERTNLVKDPTALSAIDTDLAQELTTPAAITTPAAETLIDMLILRHDPWALHRTHSSSRRRGVDIRHDTESGVSHLDADLPITDGTAFDQRLDRYAATVCDADPRTRDQRRLDAIGALGYGWDRLPCLCQRPDCPAAERPTATGGILIHVIAPPDALLPGDHPPHPHPDDPGPPEPPGGDDPDTDVPDTDECGHPEPTDDHAATHDTAATDAAEPDPAPEPVTEPQPPVTPQPPVPTVDLADTLTGLHGTTPRALPQPWYTYTLAGLLAAYTDYDTRTRAHCPARPGAILGGPLLPAPVIAQLDRHATITTLVHPGNAPPEPRYRPSAKLADFVRARDQTCRFPGCGRPATGCDLDHVIAYPHGPTHAANLACLCRLHHLLKTFWPGWTYTLDPDGTAHWQDPDGHTTTTHPGSRHLFPELCRPVAPTTITATPPPKHTAGLTMPKRHTTRAQARTYRINAERTANAPFTEQYLKDQIPPF